MIRISSSSCEQMEATRIKDQSSKFQILKREVQLAVDQLGRGEGIRNRDWDAKLIERHSIYSARHRTDRLGK